MQLNAARAENATVVEIAFINPGRAHVHVRLYITLAKIFPTPVIQNKQT